MNTNYQRLLPDVLQLAREASELIMKVYQNKNFNVNKKSDDSPITEADLLAHHHIEQGLKTLTPTIPIISEEGAVIPFEYRKDWKQLWLIDPLDGTQEFIHATDEFTINIALIENNLPVLGVAIAPALQEQYWALKNHGAFYQAAEDTPVRIHSNPTLSSIKKVAVSRRSHNRLLQHPTWQRLTPKLAAHELIYCGSALKICWVARGIIDLYPRFGITCEWDTAAGQCILSEAGGYLTDWQGSSLTYNSRQTLENPDFVAAANSYLTTLCCG